jgi:hypothetical protein
VEGVTERTCPRCAKPFTPRRGFDLCPACIAKAAEAPDASHGAKVQAKALQRAIDGEQRTARIVEDHGRRRGFDPTVSVRRLADHELPPRRELIRSDLDDWPKRALVDRIITDRLRPEKDRRALSQLERADLANILCPVRGARSLPPDDTPVPEVPAPEPTGVQGDGEAGQTEASTTPGRPGTASRQGAAPPAAGRLTADEREQRILDVLREHGPMTATDLHAMLGEGFGAAQSRLSTLRRIVVAPLPWMPHPWAPGGYAFGSWLPEQQLDRETWLRHHGVTHTEIPTPPTGSDEATQQATTDTEPAPAEPVNESPAGNAASDDRIRDTRGNSDRDAAADGREAAASNPPSSAMPRGSNRMALVAPVIRERGGVIAPDVAQLAGIPEKRAGTWLSERVAAGQLTVLRRNGGSNGKHAVYGLPSMPVAALTSATTNWECDCGFECESECAAAGHAGHVRDGLVVDHRWLRFPDGAELPSFDGEAVGGPAGAEPEKGVQTIAAPVDPERRRPQTQGEDRTVTNDGRGRSPGGESDPSSPGLPPATARVSLSGTTDHPLAEPLTGTDVVPAPAAAPAVSDPRVPTDVHREHYLALLMDVASRMTPQEAAERVERLLRMG